MKTKLDFLQEFVKKKNTNPQCKAASTIIYGDLNIAAIKLIEFLKTAFFKPDSIQDKDSFLVSNCLALYLVEQ